MLLSLKLKMPDLRLQTTANISKNTAVIGKLRLSRYLPGAVSTAWEDGATIAAVQQEDILDGTRNGENL